MIRYKLLLISLAVVFAVLACSLPGDESGALEESAPAGSSDMLEPTYTPPAISSEGGEKNYRTDSILFQDNFSFLEPVSQKLLHLPGLFSPRSLS